MKRLRQIILPTRRFLDELTLWAIKRMIRNLLISFLISMMLSSCRNDKYRYTIITTNLSNSEEFVYSGAAELSDSEIVILETLIKKCIIEYNNEIIKNTDLAESEYKNYLIEDFENYLRQYVPFINEFGEKVIWVNAFCTTPKNWDWKTQILGTDDGGNCYFNLSINFTQKTCHEIRVNDYL